MHTIILQKENNLLKTILNKGINIEHVMPDQESEDGSIGGSPLHLALALESFKSAELLMSKMKGDGLELIGDDESHSALNLALRQVFKLTLSLTGSQELLGTSLSDERHSVRKSHTVESYCRGHTVGYRDKSSVS